MLIGLKCAKIFLPSNLISFRKRPQTTEFSVVSLGMEDSYSSFPLEELCPVHELPLA